MKVSIITVSYNSQDTIEDTIKSVLGQAYPGIEYIIVDGKSRDNTLEIIDKYKDKISNIISESDKGIYDAINKGIKAANGDIVGILNSDDLYADSEVIDKVVQAIRDSEADCCWGDLVYVNRNDTDKIIRNWKSSEFREGLFKTGWMPPHPTFFVKKWVYEKYGLFDLDLSTAADYEIMLRFLKKYKIKSCYVPKLLVKMRIGGRSNKNLRNMFRKSLEDYQAWKINDLKGNMITIFKKNIIKIPQFFIKK
jgi:glycosyltransferase involved in cell wall biosynthesis